MPAAQENARYMFNLPGMLIVHGYLPPVKPDKYVHTTITLELCLDTMASMKYSGCTGTGPSGHCLG
jgi:hypothetical protein